MNATTIFDLFKKDPAKSRARFKNCFPEHSGAFEALLAGNGDPRDYHRLIAEMWIVEEPVEPQLGPGTNRSRCRCWNTPSGITHDDAPRSHRVQEDGTGARRTSLAYPG